MKNTFYALLLLPLGLGACHKDQHMEEDLSSPVIELSSPQQSATYAIGDTIRIQGRMWDNDELHEASITMAGLVQASQTMNCPMMVHELKEYPFDTCYVVKTSDLDGLRLTVKAEDHHDNEAVKILELNIKN